MKDSFFCSQKREIFVQNVQNLLFYFPLECKQMCRKNDSNCTLTQKRSTHPSCKIYKYIAYNLQAFQQPNIFLLAAFSRDLDHSHLSYPHFLISKLRVFLLTCHF